MDEYEYLNVWYHMNSPPERFQECKASISPTRVLIVMVGKETHVWNADNWQHLEGKPLVRV